MFRASNTRCPRSIENNPDFIDRLLNHLYRVQQSRPGNDRGPVLVIVKYGNLHRLLQCFFDVETFRRLDVFEIDAAEGGLQQLNDFDDVVRIVALDFEIENIHVGEPFKQNALPFHHRLARERPNVSEPSHCC